MSTGVVARQGPVRRRTFFHCTAIQKRTSRPGPNTERTVRQGPVQGKTSGQGPVTQGDTSRLETSSGVVAR